MNRLSASFVITSFVCTYAHADITGRLNVATVDNTTCNTFPYKVIFPNANCTDNGDGTVSISITGGGGGSSTLAVSSGSASSSVIISSPTSNLVFSSNTFIGSLQGTTSSFITINPSSATLLGPTPNASNLSGMLQAAQFPALTGDITTPGASLNTTAAATQPNIVTLSASSTTVSGAAGLKVNNFSLMQGSASVTGAGGITSTFGVKAATAQITGLGTNTNICTDGSSNLTTTACNNGTITGVVGGTGLTGSGTSGSVTLAVASTAAFTTSTETFTAAQQFISSVTFSSNTFQRDGIYISTNSGIVNANYMAKTIDNIILASATAAGITITLNFSSNTVGQTVEIMKVSKDTFTINIAVSGTDLIDGTTGLMQISAYSQTDVFYSVGLLNGVGVWVGDKLQITPQFAAPQAGAPSSSGSVGTSSTTYIQGFYVPVPMNVVELDIPINTQSGNLDLGIYDSTGTLLFHTGNVAVATPGLQTQTVNSGVGINLSPGYYYYGLVVNNTTALLGRYSGYNNTPACKSFTGTTTVLASRLNMNGGTLGNECFMIWGKVAGGATF